MRMFCRLSAARSVSAGAPEPLRLRPGGVPATCFAARSVSLALLGHLNSSALVNSVELICNFHNLFFTKQPFKFFTRVSAEKNVSDKVVKQLNGNSVVDVNIQPAAP